MLLMRNIRSRTVSGKQAEAVMTDHPSKTSSPTQNYTSPISPLFGNSPRLFTNFSPKFPSDPEAVITMMSPTSILDTKQIYPPLPGGPFDWYERNLPKPPEAFSGNKHSWEKLESGGIGLALVDSLNDERVDGPKSSSKAGSRRKVLFGSQLKIQIPPLPQFSPAPRPSSQSGSANSDSQIEESERLSMDEMELSENYTCVISHGPNPKTTHIFDDCIVESRCGEVGSFALRRKKKKEELSLANAQDPNSPLQNYLSFCYTCKRKLGQEKDIYMYRGEKAFCSRECRSQEMLRDGVGEF